VLLLAVVVVVVLIVIVIIIVIIINQHRLYETRAVILDDSLKVFRTSEALLRRLCHLAEMSNRSRCQQFVSNWLISPTLAVSDSFRYAISRGNIARGISMRNFREIFSPPNSPIYELVI